MNGILFLTTAVVAAFCIGGAYGASPRATCLEQCTKTEVICRQQNSCDLWTRGLFAGKRGKFAEAMKRFAAEEPEEGTGPSPCDDCTTNKGVCDAACSSNGNGKNSKREFLEGLSSYLDLVGF